MSIMSQHHSDTLPDSDIEQGVIYIYIYSTIVESYANVITLLVR